MIAAGVEGAKLGDFALEGLERRTQKATGRTGGTCVSESS